MDAASKKCIEIIEKQSNWSAPELGADISFGDMPGDKISIGSEHIRKAVLIFPELLKHSLNIFSSGSGKVVITVCGGSGVGKSEIASLLSYYFCKIGIGSYTLSGDNYPHRIPLYNDAERLRIFRVSGIRSMVRAGQFNEERLAVIRELQQQEEDANTLHLGTYSWLSCYIDGGLAGLKSYLGTQEEIDFQELEHIVAAFKRGDDVIWLKRMGRGETELWYEAVDFAGINILIIEWTHGNSDNYKGVDIPILLNSTPQETLTHRKERNRDGKTDSAFTKAVLELEQEMLKRQAGKAKIIVSKQSGLLSYDQYQQQMEAGKESSDE